MDWIPSVDLVVDISCFGILVYQATRIWRLERLLTKILVRKEETSTSVEDMTNEELVKEHREVLSQLKGLRSIIDQGLKGSRCLTQTALRELLEHS